MRTKTNTNFSNKRQVNYLSKDFTSFKENLIKFAQTYYPDTYKDFSEGSTGTMFIDLASYVGDVLSYYTDYQFNESFLVNATERQNLLSAARFLGYKSKLSRPAFTVLDVYQVIPSTRNLAGDIIPDDNFALTINSNMVVSNADGIKFITESPVDFSENSVSSPREVSVFSRTEAGEPDTFLLKKQVNAKSAEIVTENISVGSAEQFKRIVLSRDNAIEILSVIDSDGNDWYEVDYLAQDIVIQDKQNIDTNDIQLSRFKDSVPFILGSLKTSRKFITGINENDRIYLEFGSGENVSFQDEEINNIKSVAIGQGVSNFSIDPTSFLKGRNYGLIPQNTTLTIRYLAGGGVESNLGANELTNIASISYAQNISDLSTEEQQLVRTIRSSVRVNNPSAATGGRGSESSDEIRNNAILYFNAQNRTVSSEDYLARILSMPPKYGSVSKAYVASEDEITRNSDNQLSESDKSFSVNLYILSSNANNKLTTPNKALVHNVKQYLRRNRILTDDITIRSGNIINIGVNFEIIVYSGENKQEVLFNVLEVVKRALHIDNMGFNQPLNLNTLTLEMANVVGVQSVSKLEVKNLTSANGDYSPNSYSISDSTRDGIVYPSLDPSVFEVKFPNKDIIGKVK